MLFKFLCFQMAIVSNCFTQISMKLLQKIRHQRVLLALLTASSSALLHCFDRFDRIAREAVKKMEQIDKQRLPLLPFC